MKTTIKTLILALLATLSFSACNSDDNFPSPETKDLVGKWWVTHADKRVIEDSLLWFTLNADGTVIIESYYALATKPEEQTAYAEGKWMLKDKEGKTVLEIFQQYFNPWTNEEESLTIDYCILKFGSKKFKATTGTTEFDFVRE